MATKKRLHQTFDEVQEILDSVPSMTNVQADWNENDTTKDDYIKNRTHWDGPGSLTNARLSWTGSTLTQDMPFVLSGTGSDGTQSFSLVNSFWDTASVLPNGTWMVEIAGHTWKVDIMYRDLYVTIDDNDVFFQRFRSGTGTITATSPVDLNTSIPIVTVHKLDNKYLDLDSTPTQNSAKPVTSGGVYDYLIGSAKIKSGTTAYWNASSYKPAKDEIIVYTDKSTKIVDGQSVDVPGIKIGGGNAYVTDIAFVADDVAASLVTHMNNTDVHITAQERQFWNGKVSIDESQAENKILAFTTN